MDQDRTNETLLATITPEAQSVPHMPLASGWQVGKVQQVDERGAMQVLVQGQSILAWPSGWLNAGVLPGQLVLLALPPGHAALVVGVYPDEANPESHTAVRYEASTDTLVLKATNVRIEGAQNLTLSTGASQLQLDAQGHFEATAQSILQSASGSYRLEGATVDIN